MKKLKLDDSVIAHIVKLVQLGFLQGLDVVDYFRQIELVSDELDDKSQALFLSKEYLEKHEKEIQQLLDQKPSESLEE
jgi:hypothetical protein